MTNVNHTPVELLEMLLDKLRQEQWEDVSVSAQTYIAAIQQMMLAYQQAVVPDEKESMARLLREMQRKQTEIIGRLQARMQGLEESMVRLQKGKSGCQHYAAQIPVLRG